MNIHACVHTHTFTAYYRSLITLAGCRLRFGPRLAEWARRQAPEQESTGRTTVRNGGFSRSPEIRTNELTVTRVAPYQPATRSL